MSKDQKKKFKKFQQETSARNGEMKRNEEKLVGRTIYKTNQMEESQRCKFKSQNRKKEKPLLVCDNCQNEFPKRSQLKQHVAVHTGQKDFHCNLCDYATAKKGDLTVHIRRHTNERPFKCQEPNCGASFTTSSHLKRHQLVHNKKDKKFSCSLCPFKTSKKETLIQHVKNIHSDSRPFECPHENCEYSAKQKSNLSRHLKIYHEEKHQICPHPNCGFKTKWPSYLKIHLQIHSNGEKRFQCHFCDYSSHHHGDLILHIRRHTGETPFACQLCSFKSKQKSNLNQHMKTHRKFLSK